MYVSLTLTLSILLDPFHEEVRYPERVEQVSGSLEVVPVVLLEVQELEYISMPRLEAACI